MQNLIQLDQNVFNWFNALLGHNSSFDLLIKFIAVYFIWLIPLVILVAWFISHPKLPYRQLLLEAFLVGFLAWQVVCRFIGNWVWVRERPLFASGTKELFFHLPTYSFPSDHAAFLAGFTTYFYLSGYKKIGHIFAIVTIIISIARIISGVHWPLDVLIGWIIGILSALLIWKLVKYYRKYLIEPLLWLAKKIKLA